MASSAVTCERYINLAWAKQVSQVAQDKHRKTLHIPSCTALVTPYLIKSKIYVESKKSMNSAQNKISMCHLLMMKGGKTTSKFSKKENVSWAANGNYHGLALRGFPCTCMLIVQLTMPNLVTTTQRAQWESWAEFFPHQWQWLPTPYRWPKIWLWATVGGAPAVDWSKYFPILAFFITFIIFWEHRTGRKSQVMSSSILAAVQSLTCAAAVNCRCDSGDCVPRFRILYFLQLQFSSQLHSLLLPLC